MQNLMKNIDDGKEDNLPKSTFLAKLVFNTKPAATNLLDLSLKDFQIMGRRVLVLPGMKDVRIRFHHHQIIIYLFRQKLIVFYVEGNTSTYSISLSCNDFSTACGNHHNRKENRFNERHRLCAS
jgi:hypothetical protein